MKSLITNIFFRKQSSKKNVSKQGPPSFFEYAPPTVIFQILLNLPQDDLIHLSAVNTRIRNVFRQPNTKYEYYKRASILKVKSIKEAELYLSINPNGFLHLKRECDNSVHRLIKDLTYAKNYPMLHPNGPKKDLMIDIINQTTIITDRILKIDMSEQCSDFPIKHFKCLRVVIKYFDKTGRISFLNNYKDGEKHGKQYKLDYRGQIRHEYNYVNGKKHGKQYEWHLNGKKKHEENYKDGCLDGKQYEWYEHGQLMVEYNYVNDKKHGKKYKWYGSGRKMVEYNYVNDKKHGKQYKWALKNYELNYKNGYPDDKQYEWHWNGNLTNERCYKDGYLHGKQYKWYGCGRKMAEYNYVNGEKDGKQYEWDLNGKLYTYTL